MGTLASELGPHAERIAGQPRLYVDANVPAGLVSFMRTRLQWDVLFVIEHDDLRRARDYEHYRLARELRRTLITFDRDYLDDRKFPLLESGGVIVLTAPEERGYIKLLQQIDAEFFRTERERERIERPEPSERFERPERVLPLEGRKVHVHVDWTGGDTIHP
jgi:predicted nuclease of predicted toxin-antitoxin system